MNINLSQTDHQQGKKEFNELTGFLLAFEEGLTVHDRRISLSKSYPVFSKILDILNSNLPDEFYQNGSSEKETVKKKKEHTLKTE